VTGLRPYLAINGNLSPNVRNNQDREQQTLRVVRVDRDLIDADETVASENPIGEAQASNPENFFLLCGFSF
jgi:hypothetical protein